MDPVTAAMLTTALSTLLGGLFGGGGGSASGTSTLTDYQRALLEKTQETQARRMIYQNPLYEQATNLASALMPRSARTTGYLQTPADPFVVNEPDGTGRDRPTRDSDGTGATVNTPTYSGGNGGGGSNGRTAAAIQALASGGFGSGSLTGPTRTGTRGITVNTPATLLSRERLMR